MGLGRGSRAQLLQTKRQNTNHRVLGSSLGLHKRCREQAALFFHSSLGGGRVPHPTQHPSLFCNVRLIFQSTHGWQWGRELDLGLHTPCHPVLCTVIAQWH